MPRPSRLPGIDHEFSDPDLLTRALTHRSHGPGHYERLEFLGDSLLNLVAAELLFERRPHAAEGDLSRLRSRLVRDRTLAEIAQDLDLGTHLRLGQGEMKSGGYLRESILADVVEALIGAVFLDGGFEEARRVVRSLLEKRERELPEADRLKDPKTRLQELLQGQGHDLPEYEVLKESGADHAKRFEVECRVGELAPPVRAEAGSRRKAEQAAARIMHQNLLERFGMVRAHSDTGRQEGGSS
ncbi:ribonuclease III [Wenzhouxiangella marina]|uniref:Ribonuclease 3 n=1 Tax=Wenzhouxiangella marina TaxID=1579979 RepID=A0A0K0XXN0_9GAMM|nr:ribonuclease III [Wenzhouxiangella marina]AKS42438.1 Ribonuclease III [Wenzhouxiangella marina]MBB6085787.1 ribonuclease-3 [Wenzhouxiangella marina]